jgi:hypothetical protein
VHTSPGDNSDSDDYSDDEPGTAKEPPAKKDADDSEFESSCDDEPAPAPTDGFDENLVRESNQNLRDHVHAVSGTDLIQGFPAIVGCPSDLPDIPHGAFMPNYAMPSIPTSSVAPVYPGQYDQMGNMQDIFPSYWPQQNQYQGSGHGRYDEQDIPYGSMYTNSALPQQGPMHHNGFEPNVFGMMQPMQGGYVPSFAQSLTDYTADRATHAHDQSMMGNNYGRASSSFGHRPSQFDFNDNRGHSIYDRTRRAATNHEHPNGYGLNGQTEGQMVDSSYTSMPSNTMESINTFVEGTSFGMFLVSDDRAIYEGSYEPPNDMHTDSPDNYASNDQLADNYYADTINGRIPLADIGSAPNMSGSIAQDEFDAVNSDGSGGADDSDMATPQVDDDDGLNLWEYNLIASGTDEQSARLGLYR